MSADYVTLRCRFERHDLCRSHTASPCTCTCHHLTLPLDYDDPGDQLQRAYQPLAATLTEMTA